jgi:hypothetical protein
VILGNNASDTCAMLSEIYGGEAMKSQMFLNGINGSKRACMSESQMKPVLITFFSIKGIVHFKFIPQGQIVNQAYVKLCIEKGQNFGPALDSPL